MNRSRVARENAFWRCPHRLSLHGLVIAIGLVLLPLMASADEVSGPTPDTLIKTWLAFPDVENVAWPYAYIRAESTARSQSERKTDILAELANLKWRLEGSGRSDMLATVKTWRSALEDQQSFRLPGDWSPGWLMAHPNQTPSVEQVAAVGACEVPGWIEIWDRNGIQRIDWRSGLTLSRLLFDRQVLDGGGAPQVAVVTPRGEVSSYGIQAWNFADTNLSPGTRIVAQLPLPGQAFPWIQEAIADLLAHSPSGKSCREISVAGIGTDG